MANLELNPTTVEVIIRNQARLLRIKEAMKKENEKSKPDIDRIKQLGVELKRREALAKEVSEVLK